MINKVYFPAEGNRRTIPQAVITAAVQLNSAGIYKLQTLQADGTVFPLTGQTAIAGTRKNLVTNAVTALSNAFTVTHDSNGEMEWTPSATDTDTAADFEVQITVTFTAVQTSSYPILWEVVALATV